MRTDKKHWHYSIMVEVESWLLFRTYCRVHGVSISRMLRFFYTQVVALEKYGTKIIEDAHEYAEWGATMKKPDYPEKLRERDRRRRKRNAEKREEEKRRNAGVLDQGQ